MTPLTSMFQATLYILVFLFAFGIAAIGCPIAIALAQHFGFTDNPDGRRKQHSRSTPLGGGIAIFFATVVSVAMVWGVFARFDFGGVGDAAEAQWSMLVLLLASLIIMALGICDDFIALSGLHKLGGQLVAAGIMMAGGYSFHGFEFAGFTFDVGHAGLIITLFWILGAINAVNLIDGADGVAATLGIGICTSLGVVSVLAGEYQAAIIPFALGGATLGFLIFNFPPARLYLGDCGSMLIGLVAAGTAIQGSTKSQATFALAAPVALLAIPIVDTSFAIFRRKLMGRSIYDTDRGHIHHCLLDRGITPRQVVFLVAGLTSLTSVGAIASTWVGLDLLSLMAVVIVLAILSRWRLFGRGELQLIGAAVKRRLERYGWLPSSNGIQSVHIQGSRDWGFVWNRTISEFLDDSSIKGAQLTLSMPWLHEAFLGRTGDMRAFNDRSLVQLSLPIHVDGKIGGWLRLVGIGRGRIVAIASGLLSELEKEIENIAMDCEFETAPRPHIAASSMIGDGVASPTG